MEEFRIKAEQRFLFWIFTVFSFFVIIFIDDYFRKAFIAILTLVLIFFAERKIILESDRIILKSVIPYKDIKYSEIYAMRIGKDKSFTFRASYDYYLELKKNEYDVAKISDFFNYEDTDTIIKTLEKNTGKKVKDDKIPLHV